MERHGKQNMLGNIVEVISVSAHQSVASPETVNFYCGHIFRGGEISNRQKAYVLGTRTVPTRFIGRVIATWKKPDEDVSYPIVVARNRVMYEPEIRVMLGLPQFSDDSIVCLHEKSCGAVIFRREGQKTFFLIVKTKKSKNWGFPKGHVELNESEEETALREVREETGLNVSIIPGFRSVSRYSLWNHAFKQVVFFLAESKESRIVLQEEELERARWLPYSAAINLFWFENDKNTLRNACAWLKKHHLV